MRVFALRAFALLAVAASLTSGCRRSTPVLARSALYDIDSVRAVMAVSGSDSLRWESYRSAADTAASWEAASGTMKSIICRAPSAGGYFQLGNILLRGRQYREAITAFNIAAALRFVPLSEAYYGLCAAYAQPDTSRSYDIWLPDSAAYYMKMALSAGYDQPLRFLKDTIFTYLRGWDRFMNVYDSVKTAAVDGKQLRWHTFLAGFPEVTLPLTMDTSWMEQQRDFAPISTGFVDFLPSRDRAHWSRGMEEAMSYVAKIQGNSAYTAVIYMDYVYNDMAFTPPPPPSPDAKLNSLIRSSTEYELITFGPDGKCIDHLPVAGHFGWSQPLLTCVIAPSTDFTVSALPFRYVGAEYEGKVERLAVRDVRHYRIDAGGHFVRLSGGGGMRGALTRE